MKSEWKSIRANRTPAERLGPFKNSGKDRVKSRTRKTQASENTANRRTFRALSPHPLLPSDRFYNCLILLGP